MPKTYRAILHGDCLEWTGEPPAERAQPVDVGVTVPATAGAAVSDGLRMAEALDHLSVIGAYGSIRNPVRWQRMVREERPLPGRD